jgi:UDP-N-acetylglucosamine--N-acetylmuramyl-(pentapeptide) pyrophosphoryl-undecaprenol N-acetylglucosamine transferase
MTGGGSGGPVTPLLAIAAEWKKREPDVQISWIGTPNGPERTLVEAAKFSFSPLSAPKFDRTRPWTIPFVPFQLVTSCVKAIKLLQELEPSMVISAGAYVSVPVIWMAWLLRIPVWIHQLDVEPGMANKLMAPFAKRISVTFQESMSAFSAKKTELVGCMYRKVLRLGEKEVAQKVYGLDASKPTVVVMGGATGAAKINEIMSIIGRDLAKRMNVLHLTGRGKMLTALEEIGGTYVPMEFLGEGIADVYAAADVVIARAGIGTIAELAALGKPSIILPIVGTHQEANAQALEERNAAIVMRHVTPQTLEQAIYRLLDNQGRREELSKNIHGLFPLNADERIVHEAIALLNG